MWGGLRRVGCRGADACDGDIQDRTRDLVIVHGLSPSVHGTHSSRSMSAPSRLPRRPNLYAARRLLAGGLLLSACACTDNLSPEQLATLDARQFVTADVAAQMTPDGRFPDTRPANPETQRTNAQQARVLAQAYVTSFSAGLLAAWSQEAGRNINRDRLGFR
jgi:hypothetical protein